MSNDATSGGYAEWFAQQEKGSIAYLSLEGGVGGAVLIDGVPYTGANGRSGEFGHICVQPGGLPCQCGQHGCLEAYCSSARLSTDLGVTVEQFFAGLEAGNLAYRTLWSDYLRHLAVGLAARDPFAETADYVRLCHYPKHAVPLGVALHFINQFIEAL